MKIESNSNFNECNYKEVINVNWISCTFSDVRDDELFVEIS